MDTTFRPKRALLGFGLIWLGIVLWSADIGAEPDFSQVSDVDLFFHEDKEEAMDEYERRTREYTPQQVREIEAEFIRQVRLPREKVEPTVDELLAKINHSDDVLKRMKCFAALHEQYETAVDSEKGKIRDAFLAAWGEVPYPATYEDDQNNNMSRYRDYAHQAGLYFTSEEELLPLLEERCLNIDAADRHVLFASELARARITLGPIAARLAERLYQELILNRENPILNCNESTINDLLIRTMGRCGKPGVDALIRLGKETSEEGVWALGFNASPESESILWKMFANTPERAARTRLDILRALYAKVGTPAQQTSRNERLRPELVRYLQLSEGKIDLWAVQDAVTLAKDSKDPYYLSHVTTLETALFRVGENNYECSGMEDRMDEALASLRESFDETIASLEFQATGEN